MDHDGALPAGEEPASGSVVWSHTGRFNVALAVGAVAAFGLVGVIVVVWSVASAELIGLAAAALFLTCAAVGLRSILVPSSRWDTILVTDDEVIRVQRSGRRRSLPRSEVVSVTWDAEWGSSIRRRGFVHREWYVPLGRSDAREMAAALEVPFRG